MVKLNPSIHPKLTHDIIQKLQRKNVSTVIELILEDSEKLLNITGFPHKDVLELKQNILEKYGGVVKNASDIFEIEQKNIVSTDLPSLDALLEGGLYPGQIYELCGISSCGKTQLCLSIACNVALKPTNLVRYIDTKKDFCGSRIEDILTAKNYSKQVIDHTMARIRVCSIQTSRQLFKVLHYLTTALKEEKSELRTRVVIIDSLPAVIFKLSRSHETTYALNRLANILRFIANEFHLSVISVNLISQWNVSSERAIETAGVIPKTMTPTLGKYWMHVPNTRLLIEKSSLRSRTIKIWKSFQLKANLTCTLNISDSGFT